MTREQLMLVQEMMRKRIEGATNVPVNQLVNYWELTSALASLVAAAWRVEASPTQKLKFTPKVPDDPAIP